MTYVDNIETRLTSISCSEKPNNSMTIIYHSFPCQFWKKIGVEMGKWGSRPCLGYIYNILIIYNNEPSYLRFVEFVNDIQRLLKRPVFYVHKGKWAKQCLLELSLGSFQGSWHHRAIWNVNEIKWTLIFTFARYALADIWNLTLKVLTKIVI